MPIECEHGSLARSCLICELQERVRELERRLAEYVGWAPDQFLRYQEEHRKLQKAYIELERQLASLQRRIGELEQELSVANDAIRGNIIEIARLAQQLAEARAERDRAFDGCAKLHERSLGGAK